jgi:hypothetical protein
MWLETDHHGMVNLDYVKRIDLAGDVKKKTLGIYLFDVEGNTYPIVDIPRFKNIRVLKGNEIDQDTQIAIYTFCSVAKKLIATSKDSEVITVEAIYKEFASEWYAHQKKELPKTEEKEKRRRQKEPTDLGEQGRRPLQQENSNSDKVHHFSDMKQLLDAHSEIYLSKFRKKPPIHYRTGGKIAQELVKLYPLEKLRTMLRWYFESDEDFIAKAQYDMKTLKAILERTHKVSSSEDR